jgi:hypothetical protein
MTTIGAIPFDLLRHHLDQGDAEPVWAIEFPATGAPKAWAAPAGTLTPLELRQFAARAITADCDHATLEPVWSGVIMTTPWMFMRCPIDTIEDINAAHPLNKGATAFVRSVEHRPCPCSWYGSMVFAPRRDRARNGDLAPIDVAALRAAIDTYSVYNTSEHGQEM